MLVGSYFWGCLADTKGRKIVLIATLLIDGFCGLLSSVAQYYSLFMLFRFFNGFGYVQINITTKWDLSIFIYLFAWMADRFCCFVLLYLNVSFKLWMTKHQCGRSDGHLFSVFGRISTHTIPRFDFAISSVCRHKYMYIISNYTENILCWMEIFWTIGIIALPCMYLHSDLECLARLALKN